MDTNNLLQALHYSVGKTQNEVQMAEQFLMQAKTQEGFIPNLLLFACNRDLNLYVRQSAIINLKTAVNEYWANDPQHTQEYCLSHADKETLRASVLDAIIQCVDQPKIYKQMEEIIKYIAFRDFPTQWKSILPDVVAKLKGSDKFADIYGSLLVLKNLVKNFQTAEGLERESLEVIVSNTFPLLEVYAKNLLTNYNEQSAAALHTILKTFHQASYSEIPHYFLDEKIVDSWMTFFKIIIDKDVAPELESPTEDREIIKIRSKNFFWLNKKAVGRILVHFMRIYVKVHPSEKDQYFAVSTLFINKYAIPFLESFLKILYKKKDHFVPIKVLYFAMKYVYRALSFPDLEKLLVPHAESLLFDLLIPAMFLTIEDDEDWSTNTIEFIRKESDYLERPNNIKSVAKDYFITLCGPNFMAPDGELFLMKFMQYAASVLTNNVDPRTNQPTDLRMREALLNVIGNLDGYIMQSDYLRQNLEFLLDKYVIPECKNSVGFLRYRACWLCGLFSKLEFQNPEIVKLLIENLYNCILDSEFPVKVNAAIGLSKIMRQPQTKEALKPVLSQILTTYLQLIEAMDHDDLVQALELFISQFEDDIHPYAVELVQHLTNTFANANKDQDDNEDEGEGEDDERTFAADKCLSAITRIINCNLAKDTLASIENIVKPVIDFTFTEKGADYIISGLEILTAILYHSDHISETMWSFFPELNYIIAGKPDELIQSDFTGYSAEKMELMKLQSTGWGYEFVDDAVCCFQNYIQKGKNILFQARDNYFNISYLELLFKTIDKTYQQYQQTKVSTEAIFSTLWYICLLENYPGQINEVVQYILDKIIEYIQIGDKDFKKILLETFSMCLWYDVFLTLQHLENKGATQLIFQNWIELLPEYTIDFECERLMYGFASLFRVDVTKYPEFVLSNLPGILRETVKLSAKIIKIKEDGEFEDEAEEDQDAEKLAYQKLQQSNQNNGGGYFDNIGDDDDDEDDEDYNDMAGFEQEEKGKYSSPLEDNCVILYLKESLGNLQQIQNDAYNQLISTLTEEEQNSLQSNFEKAEKDQQDFEKYKQEEAQKKQLQGMGHH